MSDEPKVVSINGGGPAELLNETPQKVFDVLDWATNEMKGETHTAVGVVIVDHMGRVATHHFWKAGFAHQSISGAAILQKRMIENHEKALEER